MAHQRLSFGKSRNISSKCDYNSRATYFLHCLKLKCLEIQARKVEGNRLQIVRSNFLLVDTVFWEQCLGCDQLWNFPNVRLIEPIDISDFWRFVWKGSTVPYFALFAIQKAEIEQNENTELRTTSIYIHDISIICMNVYKNKSRKSCELMIIITLTTTYVKKQLRHSMYCTCSMP